MKIRRHPVMSFFAGAFFGFGIMLILFTMGFIPMTVQWLGIGTLGFAVLGTLVAYAIPPSNKKKAVPATP